MSEDRLYRRRIGFTSQAKLKANLGAKDIEPPIDWDYLGKLQQRIIDVLRSVNTIIHPSARSSDIDAFIAQYVELPVKTLKDHGHIHRLKNQGRRKEQVLFNWLRGHAFAHYLKPSICEIFQVGNYGIQDIGDDDYRDPTTFNRTARADLEIKVPSGTIRVEAQSGFQGINDIKRHKVVEARRHFLKTREHTIIFHGCFFSGRAAILPISTVDPDDVPWVSRAQMEGQLVIPIEDSHYCWWLMDKPPVASEINALKGIV